MKPPDLDPVEFIRSRILWRYKKGLCESECKSHIYLGDARAKLRRLDNVGATLLITSPPYKGITNYEYDNWIRLWLLGGAEWPVWRQTQRYSNEDNYEEMIEGVFSTAKKMLAKEACLVVRTDRRRFTLETTAYALNGLWPKHRLYGRVNLPQKPTQTALFGDKSRKPGEIDLLVLPSGERAPNGFLDVAAFSQDK